MSWQITAFYQFHPLEASEVESLTHSLRTLSEETSLCGLILIGPEGINGTVAAQPDDMQKLKSLLGEFEPFHEMMFKDSQSEKRPFRRFTVRIREQILTLPSREDLPQGENGHLSPEQWHEMLSTEEDILLLDIRNWYETELGAFRGAIDPKVSNFSELVEWCQTLEVPKDQKVLMYCTGGIRCEKASLAMQSQGFSQVYQLEGGILNYLAHYPEGEFEGECFVFDHRVAVTSDLNPSERYALCPHCGNPAEQWLECRHCQKATRICQQCLAEVARQTCSKNCAYHFARLDGSDVTSD